MKLLSSFQKATQILTFQPIKANFVYEVLRNYPKKNEYQQSRLIKMLSFVLPTENRLVASFWTFFKFLGNQGELERTETIKNFC